MYHHIKGILCKLKINYAVVENNGIGYKIAVSQNTFSAIVNKLNVEVTLLTQLIVREDSFDLYGFISEEEQNLFTKLLGVSGVGPKAAMSILSSMTPSQLNLNVQKGDVKAISRANGIGLKTAQKIIIELKGKLDLTDTESGETADNPLNDAVESLVVLGYSRGEVMTVLKNINLDQSIENIITEALKKLNKI